MSKNMKIGIEIKAYDKFSQVMKKMERSIEGVSKKTVSAQERFDKFRYQTSAVTGALKTMGTVALATGAALTGLAVKSGAEFEKSMDSFSALTGLMGRESDKAGDFALQASKKFGMSASEIIDGTTRLASAKSDLMDPAAINQLTGMMTSVLRLSEIADISATQATESLVSTLNTFGDAENAKEMADFTATALDKMAMAAKVGKMPVQQLTMALSRSAGAMEGAGLTFEESLAALQVGALTGLKPSMIGRQMKNIAIKMKQANATMGEEGGKSFTEVIESLSRKKLDITQLTKAVGAENVLVMKALIDFNKTGAKFASQIEKDSYGKAVEMFEQKTGNLLFSTQKLWRTVQEKLIKIYNDFLGPVLTKGVDKLIKFTDWLFSGTKSAKMFALALGGLGAVLTTLFGILSGVFAVSTVVMWAGAVKAALVSIGITANVFFGGIPMIIGAIIALLPSLWALSAWMRGDSEKSFFEVLYEDVMDFWSVIKSVFSFFYDIWEPIIKFVMPKFEGQLQGVGQVIKWIFMVLAGLSTLIIVGIVTPFVALFTVVMSVWKAITWVSDLFKSIKDSIMSFRDWAIVKIFDEQNALMILRVLDEVEKIMNPDRWIKYLAQKSAGISDEQIDKWNEEDIRKRYESLRGATFKEAINSNSNSVTNVFVNVDKEGKSNAKVEGDTKASVKTTTTGPTGGGSMNPVFNTTFGGVQSFSF